jgi:Alginate lyase
MVRSYRFVSLLGGLGLLGSAGCGEAATAQSNPAQTAAGMANGGGAAPALTNGGMNEPGIGGNLTDMSGGKAGVGGSSGASAGSGGAGTTGGAGAGADGGASTAFVHPGILVNQAMLDFVKAKVTAGEQPWKNALTKAQSNKFGQLSYTPHPRAVVDCGSSSIPDNGCSDEKNDSMAAYTHALIWAYTGNEANAKKAIEIMNAWSAVLTDHTNSNAPLQSAWAAEVFPRAAEIVRYTYQGWPADEVARFRKMLNDVYLPKVVNGSASNGNWEISMIEATLNIGVFNDDRASFDKAVKMWRERTPAYIYIAKDGATPVPPPRGNKAGAALTSFWYGQTVMMDGLGQETCRDMGHIQYGLAGIINAAETAYLQGVDLYGEEAVRLQAGLEFHAKYLNGAAVPSSLCGGSLTDNNANPMWEIALNHFATRKAGQLPETEKLVLKMRPTGTDHHVGWETLTHAGVGWPR